MTQTRTKDGEAIMLTYLTIGFVIGMFVGANTGIILLAMIIAGQRGENRRDG